MHTLLAENIMAMLDFHTQVQVSLLSREFPGCRLSGREAEPVKVKGVLSDARGCSQMQVWPIL